MDVPDVITILCAPSATELDMELVNTLVGSLLEVPARGEEVAALVERKLRSRNGVSAQRAVELAEVLYESDIKEVQEGILSMGVAQTMGALARSSGHPASGKALAVCEKFEWAIGSKDRRGGGASDVAASELAGKVSRLAAEHERLARDLDTVQDQLNEGREFAVTGAESGSMESFKSERWLDIVDFLTQCQPRLLTLIEAGTAGKLEESSFEKSLALNDSVTSFLRASDQIKHAQSTDTQVSVEDIKATLDIHDKDDGEEVDLLGITEKDEKQTTEKDEKTIQKPTSPPPKQEEQPKESPGVEEPDDFDAFLAERGAELEDDDDEFFKEK